MGRWGKVLNVALCVMLLWSGLAESYSGSAGIWYMKKGDFVMTNVSGDQTGYDAAKAACGNDGFIYVHPGCSFVNPGLPLTDSLLVMMHEGGILRFYSGSKVRGAPVIGVAGDAQVEGVRFEDPGAGTNYVKVVAPSTPTTHTLTLPGANASGFLQNNGSGALSWIAGSADTSGLFYRSGLPAGQVGIGSNATSSSTNTYLGLRGYNNATVTGAALLYLKQDAELHGANIIFAERTKTVGMNINTGSDFVNTTNTGTFVAYGVGGNTSISGGAPFAVQGGTSTSLAAPTAVFKAKTSQTGKLSEWRASDNTVVAYVDVNGNFSSTPGAANSTRADTIQAYKRFIGGDSYNDGFGVFEDSLRTNGPFTAWGDCNYNGGKVAVRDSARFNLGFQAGSADRVSKFFSNSVTLDVGSISANSTRDETVTVTGVDVASTWRVFVEANSDLNTGVVIGNARVSADNTVKIRFANLTASPIDPASTTFTYWAAK